MKNYKNYLIALLSGLLVLSLSTQQAQSAGESKEAKLANYNLCLQTNVKDRFATNEYAVLDSIFKYCAKYRP